MTPESIRFPGKPKELDMEYFYLAFNRKVTVASVHVTNCSQMKQVITVEIVLLYQHNFETSYMTPFTNLS